MTMFWVFLNNLKGPVAFVSVLGLIICAIIAIWSAQIRARTAAGTLANSDAQWRQVFCLKAALGIIVFFVVIQAFPAPDYNVRYVEKPTYIEKRVEVPKYATPQQTYIDIFDMCMSKSRYNADDELKLCHSQAMAAITPPQTVKIVYKYNTYKELFDNCNDNHSGGIQALGDKESVGPRNDRIALCGKLALEGSSVH